MSNYSSVKIEKVLSLPSTPIPGQFYLVESGGETAYYLSDSVGKLFLLNDIPYDIVVGENELAIGTLDNALVSDPDLTYISGVLSSPSFVGAWEGDTIQPEFGGTGQVTLAAALNAMLPSQTGNSGKFLTTDSTNPSWVSVAGYTDENAQDAVGSILVDSSTIDFTYSDSTPSITGVVIDGSITFSKLQNISTNQLLGRSTASTGVVEQISIGTGLALSGGSLSATVDLSEYVSTGGGTVDRVPKFDSSFTLADSEISDGTAGIILGITSGKGIKIDPDSVVFLGDYDGLSNGNYVIVDDHDNLINLVAPNINLGSPTSPALFVLDGITVNFGDLNNNGNGNIVTLDDSSNTFQTNADFSATTLTGNHFGTWSGSVIGISFLPTITAAKGGTGQTTYSVGDILYASGSATLSKLSDVVTGNVLISGGVTTPPSWGKVALTTHVSGVLPVANGGTNASSASITAFNNITGFTASGTTGTTSTKLVFDTSPTLVTPLLGTPTSGTLTNCTGLPIGTGMSGLAAGVATFLATPSSANLITALTDETGTGACVFATSPTLVTPLLGTPTSGTLNNCTGLPVSSGISGLASGIATFLATPSSANLISAITDETGTGALVFANTPTLVTPVLGTATASKITIASNSQAFILGATGTTGFFADTSDGFVDTMLLNSSKQGAVLKLVGTSTTMRILGNTVAGDVYFQAGATGGSNAGNLYFSGINGTQATNIYFNAAHLGFFGSSVVTKPVVTGSRVANPALASLLTALASLGLITDSSTI